MSITETGILLTVNRSRVSCQRMRKRVTKKSKAEFAAALKAWRKKTTTTQAQAAETLGVPLRTLENWEVARTKPSRITERLLRAAMEQRAKKPTARKNG